MNLSPRHFQELRDEFAGASLRCDTVQRTLSAKRSYLFSADLAAILSRANFFSVHRRESLFCNVLVPEETEEA